MDTRQRGALLSDLADAAPELMADDDADRLARRRPGETVGLRWIECWIEC